MCGRKNWIRSLKYWILIVNLLPCSSINLGKITEPLSLHFIIKMLQLNLKNKNAAVNSYLIGRLSEAVHIGMSDAVAKGKS